MAMKGFCFNKCFANLRFTSVTGKANSIGQRADLLVTLMPDTKSSQHPAITISPREFMIEYCQPCGFGSWELWRRYGLGNLGGNRGENTPSYP